MLGNCNEEEKDVAYFFKRVAGRCEAIRDVTG